MKTLLSTLTGLVLCAGIASVAFVRQQALAEDTRNSEASVLEMKSVPDGHFLLNLQVEGRDRFVNIKVKENVGECVKSSDARFKELRGEFKLIGNGVFLVTFRNANHVASQFWVFRKDGSAAVKEIPDRGEKQLAIPVENDSLEAPRKSP